MRTPWQHELEEREKAQRRLATLRARQARDERLAPRARARAWAVDRLIADALRRARRTKP